MPQEPEPPAQQTPSAPAESKTKVVAVELQFSEPLPPPELLAAYERILPGAADRILRMAEEEGRHRRSLENRAVDADIEAMRRQFTEARLGQIFAFLIAVMFIASGTYLVTVKDNTAVGLLFGAVGLGGLVSTFIWGRSKRPQGEDKGKKG